MKQDFIENIISGDFKTIARAISLAENEVFGYEKWMQKLPNKNVPVIGITGPPGAGKSTLTDALIGEIVKAGKKIAILCVDPSSPFNLGALLGDRIRMSNWYTHPQVFIRSLASRGAMGGLHPNIIDIIAVLQATDFDFILIETVGVGQSEIEIAGLADITVVVMVPEAGDEIQTMKAGLMEIADLFVVNKSDRPGADLFIKNLKLMLAPAFRIKTETIPIVKTIASTGEGVEELFLKIIETIKSSSQNRRHLDLKVEKLYQLIVKDKMKNIDRAELENFILQNPDDNPQQLFNHYMNNF